MGSAAESIVIAASVSEVWDVYFDAPRWPAWVDGFGHVEQEDGYPGQGGTLRWRSTPAGRGVVAERVVEHVPKRLHRVAFSDDSSSGELTTRFEIERSSSDAEPLTLVAQEEDYRLHTRSPLAIVTDALFVRSQIARSLARSLEGLRGEVEGVAGTAPRGGSV